MPAVSPGMDLREHLSELAVKHRVPGASLAILDRDGIYEAATGVVNVDTGVEATPDTLFQIGSISKIYAATLVMQLVDEGRVDLDAPVRTYLPELRFSDLAATEAITARHLLTHSSGLDGDFFEDTGRGDDCIERYVEACSTLPQIAPPGGLFSYCNAGFVVAGRLVEKVTGMRWDAALKTRLFDPLGVTKTVTLPEEALLHLTAAGHIIDPNHPDGDLIRTPFWHFSRSTGPAGSIVATARDLLSFVRMHLDEGVSSEGTRVLAAESTRTMQEPQVRIPDRHSAASAWGIGWMIFDWNGTRLVGHDGGTPGQTAFLRIVPEERFAVALLTNGATGNSLYRELYAEIFRERGIAFPQGRSVDATVDFDPSPYAGTYERYNVTMTIEVVDGGLVASLEWDTLNELMAPVKGIPLRQVDETTFLVRLPGHTDDVTVVFFDLDDDGRPAYVHAGGRAARRVRD